MMHNSLDEDGFRPPWPVWEDSVINSMKWVGDPKVKRNWVFEDPVDHGAMPPSISVDYWRRPNFEEEGKWTVSSEESPVDFGKYNSHLWKYKIMSLIMSSIQTLEELGRKQPFGIEHQGTSFWYNGGPNWKPWNHVYSLTKAGRGTVHSLQLNKSGLYIVRLFFMGSWRRIIVDDYFPYNGDKEPLLPRTENKFNLWPLILAKGILRIASLSWTSLNDMEDFSVITCLTGWTRCVLDCRFASINEAWDVIQMHLIREEMNKEEIKPFCLTTCSQTCLNDKLKFYCTDDPKLRTIFACISRTENELEQISPAEEHIICIMEAKIEMEDTLKELSSWKKFRWLDWIRHHNNNKFLEMIKGIVKIYSPMRKRYTPNPYKEESFHNLAEKIVSGEISSGSLKVILYNELSPEEKLIPAKDTEEFLTYRFSTLYPHIRELEVYYKSSNFLHFEETNNLDKILQSERAPEKFRSQVGMRSVIKQMSHFKNTAQSSLHENYKMKCVFFYSESQHCKNFLITLTVCNGPREMVGDGYLAFEEYNWKSRVMGKLLFSLWTLGTRTHFLQLGNSVQVCRIWYNMPNIEHHISIRGNTPFELMNEEMLHHKLSLYSGPLINYGGKIRNAFSQMRMGILQTPEHYALINYFKTTLYPPVFDTLNADYKASFVDDFNEVFNDCLTELIFEKLTTVTKAVACLEALKLLFHDDQLGVTTIQQFTDGEKEEFGDLKSIIISNQKKVYSEKILDKLKSFRKDHELDESGIEVPSLPNLKAMSMINQKYPLYNSEDIAILDDPESCSELLRKILTKKREYVNLYPFHNELNLRMKFREFQGSTEVVPLHNWFLVIRLLVNVHSEDDVPCAIKVKTSHPKVSLVVYEIDTCKQVLCSFDVNNIYYLSRKKGGYAILVYGYPTEGMIKEQITIYWKIKIIGIDEGNILHSCYKTPVLCQQISTEPFRLHVQSITGFYIPNVDNIIGRFQIKSKASTAVTLYISLSRYYVRMRIVLRGKDKEICIAEGTGELLIPIALLDRSIAVPSAYDPEKFIFRGEIQLLGLWELDKNERIFEKKLRAQPQKDILSFDDFQDAPFDEINEEEEENIEEEEFPELDDCESMMSSPDRRTLRKKTKDQLFDVDSEEVSDDISVISPKEFEGEPPFGLLSYSPHWKISMILDELDEEGTSLEHDDQRCKTYEMFTQSWEENDPGRAERAEEKRNEFLMFGRANFMQMYLDSENIYMSDFSDYSESKEEKEKERRSSLKKMKFNRKGKKSKSSQRSISIKHDGWSRSLNRKVKRRSNIDKDGSRGGEKFIYSNYIKNRDKFSSFNLKRNDFYEQDKMRLRSGVVPFVSRPLSSKKFRKLSLVRRPLQKCTFSSGTMISSSSGFTQEILDTESFHSNTSTLETQSKPSVVLPQMSLLANVPPQEVITAVSKLSKLYCSKLHERTVIEDKSAPKDKSITKALLRKYSLPSGNTELSSFNMNIFEFDLSPRKSKDQLTIKEMLQASQETDDLKTFVSEIIEPSLYYISMSTVPEDILITPPEFLTQIEFGRAMNESFVMLKKEADSRLSAIQEHMLLQLKKTTLDL